MKRIVCLLLALLLPSVCLAEDAGNLFPTWTRSRPGTKSPIP